MNGYQNPNIDKLVKSINGAESLTIKTQRDLVSEFMKILGLAHMCVVEKFTDS
jgi:hypothetical protein